MKHAMPVSCGNLPNRLQERLEQFASILVRWNARINLVASSDLPSLWSRHIDDSIQLIPLLPQGAEIIDFGSGGGFPGLIIAICTDHPVTLIEADTRKASFLREAARETATSVTIVNDRIERAIVPLADVVTARAVAPLPVLLDLAIPKLQPDGMCLFLKGRKAEDELTEARFRWHMTVSRTASRTDPQGVILALGSIRRAEATNPSNS